MVIEKEINTFKVHKYLQSTHIDVTDFKKPEDELTGNTKNNYAYLYRKRSFVVPL